MSSRRCLRRSRKKHPARFCLCEIVNIHDESLIIEPIHRVMFGIDVDELLHAAQAFYSANECSCALLPTGAAVPQDAHAITFCTADRRGILSVTAPKWGIPLATLQAFLDDYLASHAEAKIDYIHGEDVVTNLGTQPGNMGFFLPDIEKNDLFRGVIIDGVLPRKTFSMGEAHEKRYYMEAKSIVR